MIRLHMLNISSNGMEKEIYMHPTAGPFAVTVRGNMRYCIGTTRSLVREDDEMT